MSVVIDPYQTGWVVLSDAVDLACEVFGLQYESTIHRKAFCMNYAAHYIAAEDPHLVELNHYITSWDEASGAIWHELAHARQRELGSKGARRDEVKEAIMLGCMPDAEPEYAQWLRAYYLCSPAEREAQNLSLIYNKKLKLTAPV